MFITREISPIDGELHQENLSIMLACAGANSYASLSARIANFLEPSDSYTLVPSGATFPRTTFISNLVERKLVIVLEGMANFDKVGVCLQGWATPRDPVLGTIYPYETGAVNLFAYWPTAGGNFWNQIRIIGHSYGGACAPWVAKHAQAFNAQTVFEIYTYGAPKCGLLPNLPSKVLSGIRRVFQNQDPVPSLPLSSSDLGSLWTLTGVPTARQWSRWANGFTGLTLDGQNNMIEAIKPDFQQWSGPIFSLTSWATGIRAFGADVHTLNSYVNAMAAVAVVQFPNPNPATTRNHSDALRPTNAELNRQMDLAIAVDSGLAAQDPRKAALAIQTGVPLVHGEIYHGQVVNGRQAVLYQGVVVQYVKTRRLRRALVRTLNKAIRV